MRAAAVAVAVVALLCHATTIASAETGIPAGTTVKSRPARGRDRPAFANQVKGEVG